MKLLCTNKLDLFHFMEGWVLVLVSISREGMEKKNKA